MSTQLLAKPLGLLVHPEAVAVLVAHRPEDPGGVFDEAQVVEHPDDAVPQVAEPAEEVDHRAEVLPAQGDGHGVDGEVPAEEVLADGGVLHPRQCGRMVVELGTGGGDIHVEGLPAGSHPRRRLAEDLRRQKHDRGLELPVRPHPAPQFGRQAGGELDAVSFDGDIHVDVGLVDE